MSVYFSVKASIILFADYNSVIDQHLSTRESVRLTHLVQKYWRVKWMHSPDYICVFHVSNMKWNIKSEAKENKDAVTEEWNIAY